MSSILDLLQKLSFVMTAPTFASYATVLTGWVFARRRTVTGMLVACDRFAQALQEQATNHWASAPDDLPERDCVDDQLTIKQVALDKLIFAEPSSGEDIVLSLPRSVTALAATGWFVTLELVRTKGKWRIPGVGNVHP